MWTDTLIIGAGPTGLSAAYHYRGDYVVVERESRAGGLCRSIYDRGFVFDHAGHIFFTSDPYINDVLTPMLLGENIHWQYREAWVYSKEAYTRYPFQAGTYGLPPGVVKECILGAMEAQRSYRADRRPQNFAEFMEAQWGAGICKHFMAPYNRKIWTVPLQEMSWEWLSGRVPQPNLEEIIDGALQPQPKPMGPNARFAYPLRGGFEALMRGWLRFVDSGRVWLNTRVTAVDPAAHLAVLSDGRTVHYERLISTAPLPEFLQLIAKVPAEVQEAGRQLRTVSVRCVNLGLARADVSERHWIYYPEERPLFHRVFVQSNASPHVAPAGCSSLTAEISYSPTKPLPFEGEALIERAIDDARAVGLLRASDSVLVANEADIPYGYVLPDLRKDAAVARIQEWLRPWGIISAGRFGEWKYLNTDQCFLAGRKAAEQTPAPVTARTFVPPRPAIRLGMGS
ncbi:MAG TPA: FAD-dependent oxidoreductase [Anaerolineae bacterium]|nr:FAD-dependent oxidoreductase [Anaerolineae bacterium]HOQ97429.1 FAD-dependent oxidoreductase [Anaerolineae bacterium]HPL27574.1 FAD-dependent oxidoreductase [Anaerolineae bacterium]